MKILIHRGSATAVALTMFLASVDAARGQTLIDLAKDKLAHSEIAKRLNASGNIGVVTRMRNGEMPAQPADGGCTDRAGMQDIGNLIQHRERYAELAEYARLVYEREGLQEAVRHSQLLPARRQFQEVQVDAGTSLGYTLVVQPGANGKTDVTIVYEGSTYKHNKAETINKFVHADLGQLVGTSTPEMYRMAETVYQATRRRFPLGSSNLTVTGHSLGGGLAAYIGLKYGVTAVTFNSARLSQRTLDAAARQRPEILEDDMRSVANVININSSTDVVHFMGVPGQKSYLPGPSFIFKVPGKDVTGHGMGPLSDALFRLAKEKPEPQSLCANYYGKDATWSVLKADLDSTAR